MPQCKGGVHLQVARVRLEFQTGLCTSFNTVWYTPMPKPTLHYSSSGGQFLHCTLLVLEAQISEMSLLWIFPSLIYTPTALTHTVRIAYLRVICQKSILWARLNCFIDRYWQSLKYLSLLKTEHWNNEILFKFLLKLWHWSASNYKDLFDGRHSQIEFCVNWFQWNAQAILCKLSAISSSRAVNV